MKKPQWILKQTVLAIHAEQLAEHGGGPGLRDEGLLDSALARPQSQWVYKEKETNIFQLAAPYGFGISQNHPFLDGNKPTAFVVSVLFLKINGYNLTASHEQRVITFWKLAAGQLKEDQLSLWFQQNTHKVQAHSN